MLIWGWICSQWTFYFQRQKPGLGTWPTGRENLPSLYKLPILWLGSVAGLPFPLVEAWIGGSKPLRSLGDWVGTNLQGQGARLVFSMEKPIAKLRAPS